VACTQHLVHMGIGDAPFLHPLECVFAEDDIFSSSGGLMNPALRLTSSETKIRHNGRFAVTHAPINMIGRYARQPLKRSKVPGWVWGAARHPAPPSPGRPQAWSDADVAVT
jgi:hypothetical protein